CLAVNHRDGFPSVELRFTQQPLGYFHIRYTIDFITSEDSEVVFFIILLLFRDKYAIIHSMKNLCVITTGVIATITLALTKSISASALAGGIRNGVEAARGADMPTNLLGDGGIFATA